MVGKTLSFVSIAFSLVNRNQATAFRAQRAVTSPVGVIQKEKVLPMKRLLNFLSFEYANHHVLVGVSGPVGRDIIFPRVFHAAERQVKRAKFRRQLFKRQFQKFFFDGIHIAPLFHAESIAQNMRIYQRRNEDLPLLFLKKSRYTSFKFRRQEEIPMLKTASNAALRLRPVPQTIVSCRDKDGNNNALVVGFAADVWIGGNCTILPRRDDWQ